jgi:hypothetical protein
MANLELLIISQILFTFMIPAAAVLFFYYREERRSHVLARAVRPIIVTDSLPENRPGSRGFEDTKHAA